MSLFILKSNKFKKIDVQEECIADIKKNKSKVLFENMQELLRREGNIKNLYANVYKQKRLKRKQSDTKKL